MITFFILRNQIIVIHSENDIKGEVLAIYIYMYTEHKTTRIKIWTPLIEFDKKTYTLDAVE